MRFEQIQCASRFQISFNVFEARGCGEANGVTDDGQVKEDLAYELSREVLEGS